MLLCMCVKAQVWPMLYVSVLPSMRARIKTIQQRQLHMLPMIQQELQQSQLGLPLAQGSADSSIEAAGEAAVWDPYL